MNLEKIFHELLGLDECWAVNSVDYDGEQECFYMVINETTQLWKREVCPSDDCNATAAVTCYDHSDTRSWRHLDVFGKRTELLCQVPRGRCGKCGKVYRVKLPWEGRSKHFTKGFEGFSLALMREMPVSRAAEIIGETDQRLWRMLHTNVDAGYGNLEMSDVTCIGVDEMSRRKGHNYLTVFADLDEKRVLFATPGKDSGTFGAFVEEMGRHNGHPKSITQAAIDMSSAYQKGVQRYLGNAQIVFDKFHVVALVNAAVDQVRRIEAREEEPLVKEQLKGNRWIFRKNPENLTDKEQARLSELDLKHLATGVAYQMRLNLQRAYRCRTVETARKKLNDWIRWVKRKAEKLGAVLKPMARVAETLKKQIVGLLAYWQKGLTTAYLEGLNSVFSAVKRKARGYRSTNNMITMLYFVAGKLKVPQLSTH